MLKKSLRDFDLVKKKIIEAERLNKELGEEVARRIPPTPEAF